MEKVEDIKRPLIKGEKFLVPCLVRKRILKDDQSEWMDLEVSSKDVHYEILPIINHPHSDMENGQKEVHYHLDYRFIRHYNDSKFPKIVMSHSTHTYGTEIRPLKDFGELDYYLLPVINEEFTGITPVRMIRKSKLKHKCIHKGKCPHRGYDLSQVKAVDGVRTCPLHGLKFDDNGKIIS